MSQLWRMPAARLYLAGQSLSILGDASLWLAVAIWVKELTGSSSLAAFSVFFLTLPTLFAPILGLIVDRVRRRPLLVVTNLASALVVLGLLGVGDRHQLWLIWTVMFAYGVSNSIISAAQTALLQSMLAPELLGDAQGALGAIRQGLRIVSPLIGAGVFALWGGATVAVLDAITFLVAGGCVAGLRICESKPSPSRGQWRREVAVGLAHLRQTVVLRQLCVAGIGATVVLGFIESTSFSVVTIGLGHRASWVGVTSSAMGAGAIVGGPLLGRVIRRIGAGRTAAIGLVAFAAMNAAMLVDVDTVVLGGSVLGGFGLVWVVGGAMTAIQLHTPAPIMGRVAGTFDTLLTAPQTMSIALGAALIGVLGYRWLLVALVVGMGSAGGWLFTRPEQRRATLTYSRPAVTG